MDSKVYIKGKNIVIKIPIQSISDESRNQDWLCTRFITPVEDITAMADYIVEAINEPSIDEGNGYITPIEQMIMNILQEASTDCEDFLEEENFDEDVEEGFEI